MKFRLPNHLTHGLSLVLIIATMILISGAAVLQAQWTEGLINIPIAGLIAVVAGTFLSKSIFSPFTAHLYSFIYGIFSITYLLGRSMPSNMPWRERIFDIAMRQVEWFTSVIINNQGSRDATVFVAQTAVIFWLLGYTATWFTLRHPRLWRAILPIGIVLLSIVYYYTGPNQILMVGLLVAYLLLALLYIARTFLLEEEIGWQQNAVRYESKIGSYFLRNALIAGVIAIMFASVLPTFGANVALTDNLYGINSPWLDFQQRWSRAYASLTGYATTSNDQYRGALTLSGPRNTTDTPVMDVFVDEPVSAIYWQAITWDNYQDGQWRATGENERVVHLPEEGLLNKPQTIGRRLLKQSVLNYTPNTSTLYAAPELVTADRPMFVTQNLNEKGEILVTAVQARQLLRQGEQYEVTSLIAEIDAESLRTAGTNYPSHITEKYLQVPNTVTAETRALAAELAAGFDNPYDVAINMRDYLRATITYNDQIESAPAGVDPVHYVLFDIQEGYCNYYASAMILMLREMGVPARIVAGYAQGEYDADNEFYRVRQNNAHTWVEVYFPAFGWIQFEPTASIPTVGRAEGAGDDVPEPDAAPINEEVNAPEPTEVPNIPEDVDLNPNDGLGPQELNSSILGGENGRFIPFLLGLFILASAAFSFWVARQYNAQVEGNIAQSYGKLATWGKRLGVNIHPSHTPYERAEMMVSAVPQGEKPLRTLFSQFVLTQFSPKAKRPPLNTRRQWSELRPVLYKTLFKNRLEKFKFWQK